ncbi:MAG: hypothetical protein ACUZ8E_12280 [Candidatus Anammoxibacter sp.]
MPIHRHPFKLHGMKASKPYLPIRVCNPVNDKATGSMYIDALIDTGAVVSLFPADCAYILGHNLKKVDGRVVKGIAATATTFPHKTTIEIVNPITNQPIYKSTTLPICYK